MLLNQDAKVSNFMRARAKQSGMETMSDVTQLAGSALGTPTGQVIKGNEFVNMFDPTKIINMNVNALTATGVSTGQTIGATVTSTAISTGAPLIMGSVAQGIKGATDEQYGLHTQHTDDLGPRPKTKIGRRLPAPVAAERPPARAPRSKARAARPWTQSMPEWIRKAMEEQNTLRANVYKGNTARAVGEITGISCKAGDLAGKLGIGKQNPPRWTSRSRKARPRTSPARSSTPKAWRCPSSRAASCPKATAPSAAPWSSWPTARPK